MKIAGNGAPVRVHLTRADFDQLKAALAAPPQAVPMPMPLRMGLLMGLPVHVDDSLSESVIVCASELQQQDDDHHGWPLDECHGWPRDDE